MPAARPSTCPGLLRIVPAVDGGLCRVRLPGGVLTVTQARAIDDAARRHGSGVIEATNRANLQLRGVRAGQEDDLRRALIDAGLGPLVDGAVDDADLAARDDVRNLMMSPLAGRDAHATLDSAALGASILAMLQTEPRFAALSPKFSILLDGGERLAELDHPHDIWLSAQPGRPNGPWLAAGLAGCPPVHASTAGPMIAMPATQAVAFVHALLLAFLELASGDDTRMRDLLRHVPAETLLARAQARLPMVPEVDAAINDWRRAPADPLLRFGIHAERDPELGYAGGQPPLGRLDGAQLLAVATLADSLGLATLRITPWQGLLLPGIARAALPHALSGLRALGFVCDARAPLAGVVACAGSTGCARAQADTKGDALRLAASLTQATDIHLSGCPRSCAQAHAATHTLLAVAPGRYDLYRRDAEAGFGSVVARHITIDQAAARLGGARQFQEAPDA